MKFGVNCIWTYPPPFLSPARRHEVDFRLFKTKLTNSKLTELVSCIDFLKTTYIITTIATPFARSTTSPVFLLLKTISSTKVLLLNSARKNKKLLVATPKRQEESQNSDWRNSITRFKDSKKIAWFASTWNQQSTSSVFYLQIPKFYLPIS